MTLVNKIHKAPAGPRKTDERKQMASIRTLLNIYFSFKIKSRRMRDRERGRERERHNIHTYQGFFLIMFWDFLKLKIIYH